MRTTAYLIRHGATPANLQTPAKLQGRRSDPSLAPVGERQATATRDLLAPRPIDAVYCSPLLRAAQTAKLIADPHGFVPITVDAITECDVGEWEGKSWEEIQDAEPENYARYHADPSAYGYRGGENFAQVYDRTRAAIDRIIDRHPGGAVVIVSHHIVTRVYLAGILGLGPARARSVSLDNCSISSVIRHKGKTTVGVFNSTFHLDGI
jgi:broad specificity phosphatase PhoE